MAVDVIVTLNRLTELTTGTHLTVGKHGFDVRSRLTINFLKDYTALAGSLSSQLACLMRWEPWESRW